MIRAAFVPLSVASLFLSACVFGGGGDPEPETPRAGERNRLARGEAALRSQERSLVNATAESTAPAYDALLSALWMQKGAEYGASTLQSYRTAVLALDAALADPSRSAAMEQEGLSFEGLPPAVILGVDETVLSNLPFYARLIEDREPYNEALWGQWVERAESAAVPGALEFIRTAEARGVKVFFVSNRGVESEEATRRNLERIGVSLDPEEDTLLMLGEHHWSSDKSDRRAHIGADYRIVLIVGDDLNDFVSGARTQEPEERAALVERHLGQWGRDWFILPNPLYGSWEASLHGRDLTLSEEEKRERRLEQLESAIPFRGD